LSYVAWILPILALVAATPPPGPVATGLPTHWHWARIVGLSHWHACAAGDTLAGLAARYGVEAAPLGRANRFPIDAPLPTGTRVWVGDARIVPGRTGSGILVNLPEGRLDVVLDGRHRASWPVTIGAADWPTPTGRFRLQAPVRDPAWHVPAAIRAEFARHGRALPAVVPPGPGNPLGGVWMGLGHDSLGIHAATGGTGGRGSHGCLRLAPAHAWQLAAWWRPNLTVDIVHVSRKRLLKGGVTWVERHPDPYGPIGQGQDACGVPIRE
jgi:L,D-transpeptidase ErfK/SrfK